MSPARTTRGTTVPTQRRSRQRVAGQLRRRLTWIGAAMLAATLSLPASSLALAPAPVWSLSSEANTTAAPGGAPGALKYLLEVKNAGNADSTAPSNPTCDPNNPPVDPACLVFTATLPLGLTAVDVSPANGFAFGSATCSGLGVPGPTTITCASPDVITTARHSDPGSFRVFILSTTVDPGTFGVLTTSFEVRGGGAATPSDTVDPTRITATLPGFGVDGFDGQVTDAAGDSFTQAGGHPYAASTSIDFNTRENANFLIGSAWPIEPTKDVVVDLPPGFVGNPTVVDKCTTPELAREDGKPLCPPSSQVGTTLVRINGSIGGTHVLQGPTPVFSMVAPPGVPARFGFNLAGSVVTLDAQLRSGSDYGLSVNVDNVPEGIAVAGTSLTLWGVPADSSHDSERACAGELPPALSGPTCATGTPRKAFLRNPTSCVPSPGSPVTDGLVTGLHIDSWAHPARRNADDSPDLSDPLWQTATFVSHNPPSFPNTPDLWGPNQLPTNCDSVPFNPTLTTKPVSPARAGTPTGFTFDVDLPQTDDPNAIGEADLKKAVVTLPEGMQVSPSSAGGLQGCSEAQVELSSTADANCPDASKVGTMTIKTPLLDEPLAGSVYLATPHANKFNSLIAIYLVAKGPGLIIKLPGLVESDGGRLTATFDNNPQLPFSNLHLEFKGGPRAPLVTPAVCGTYTTSSELTSWSGKTVVSKSSFTLDEASDGTACAPLGFSPGFNAGTTNPSAGQDSSFLLQLTRSDKDQQLRSLSVGMPTGLLGRIKSTTLCSDGAAAAGSCGDASKIGSVTVGAGAGSNPFYITNGRAYITGPYNGGPFGLSIVVPAVAGPFDLGNVVVRASIRVDRNTSALRVVSDPLPTILEGIVLDVRDVRVLIDRPKFIVNPTSCAEKQVGGTVGSTEGAIAHVSSRFRATDCANLSLAPKMTLSVGSKGHTAVNATTPFTTTLTQSPGQSNLRSVSVRLPLTLNARLGVVNRACTLVSFQAGHCTSKAKVGTAIAITPLLKDPLRGSAYFVKNPARALPDLMVALRGQVSLDLTGKVTIPGGTQLATTFDTVPDAPITKFTLKLVSGKNGPLGTTVNLCTAKARKATASVGFRGQNGKVLQTHPKLKINGCPKAKKARKAKR